VSTRSDFFFILHPPETRSLVSLRSIKGTIGNAKSERPVQFGQSTKTTAPCTGATFKNDTSLMQYSWNHVDILPDSGKTPLSQGSCCSLFQKLKWPRQRPCVSTRMCIC